MTKLTNEQATELFLKGSMIWTPVECECCTDEQHYTTINGHQGDTLKDLEGVELFI